ncbi:MAG: glutamate racemase [Saprospiraceae bacterium]
MVSHDKKQPIGIFDSGIGGLTVANAIMRHLPEEQLIYFGDTTHFPYGDKSADNIRFYSLKISKFLLEQGCKMIVVACNSASSTAYKDLLEFFSHVGLFVNVVDPLVRAVCVENKKKVGVIATKATINSGVYERRLKELCPDTEVVSLATPLLAPMIEEGFVHNQVSSAVLSSYLSQPELEGIEALLLACTHYPLIRDDISAYFDHKVQILDSTDIVALEIKSKLKEMNLLNDKRVASNTFYVSDYTDSFEQTARFFYKDHVRLQERDIW